MDELRYYKYCKYKNSSFEELPPTSKALTGHLLRAFYATSTYFPMNCMDQPFSVDDPREYGFEEQDDMLVPSRIEEINPHDLPQACTCEKIATCLCACHKHGITCCTFCNCWDIGQ